MNAPSEDIDLTALTAGQLEAGIHNALQAHDVQAVYGYLLLLAVKDPYRADEIRSTLLVCLRLARGVR